MSEIFSMIWRTPSHFRRPLPQSGFDPIIRGWIQYYGRFYRSGLYPLRWYLNGVLARWATRKYKKLRHHFRRAEQWLLRISRRDPQLFAH